MGRSFQGGLGPRQDLNEDRAHEDYVGTPQRAAQEESEYKPEEGWGWQDETPVYVRGMHTEECWTVEQTSEQ